MVTSALFVPPRRTGAAAMEDGASRDGMFMLEVKVEGFASKDLSGRKSYMKGHVFKWDVEFGSMTLDLLLKSLATELNLSTDQTPTVWLYDKNLKEDARLVDEIDMVDLFEIYKEEMNCKVVVRVFDRASCVEPGFDALEPLCVVPHTDADVQLEPVVSMSNQPNSAAITATVHFQKTCKLEMVGEDGETATTKKRKRTDCTADDGWRGW